MAFVKGLLDRVERRARRSESFDCRYLVALRLDGQHQAGAHRRPIQQDGAAAAHAVLAADMGPGQTEVMPKVIRQQATGINRRGAVDAVDLHAARTRSVRTFTR